MKKLICAALGLTLLSACTSYEPDMDEAQRRRDMHRAEIREIQGCPALDSHRDYRNCVIETYYKNSPRMYHTKRLRSGYPVAILSDYPPVPEKTIIKRTVEITEHRTVKSPIETESAQTAPVSTVIKEEIIETPVREKTWWENYKETKNTAQETRPQCPCADPNEPCPQCVEK